MSTHLLTLTRPETSVVDSQSLNDVSASSIGNTRIMQLTKSLYQADQQVKFLHLQAEVESLLQQLLSLKEQNLATVESPASASHGSSGS